MKSPMVTAKVSITGVGSPAPAIQQLPGKPADANATMRPMDHFDRPAKFLTVKVPTEEGSGHHFPTKILTSVIGQVDRHGRPREVEVSAIRNYGQPPSREDAREVWRMAEDTVKKVWADHFRPAIVDGKPCESLVHLNVWLGDCAGCGWGE